MHSTYAKRKQHEVHVVALVSSEIRKRNAGEPETDLVAVGVPCSLVKNVEEVFQDPQLAERGLVAQVEHPTIGPMRMMRNPVLLDHDGPAVSRSAPLLGQHSGEVLTQLGYTRDEISHLTQSGVTLCATV